MDYILDICIPVYGKINFTRNCLKDLFNLPNDHHIIVADDGSTDTTENELRAIQRSNFTYLRSPVNQGFARTANLAYTAVKSPNVLFLNNDIKVKPSCLTDWTAPLIQACSESVLAGPTVGHLNKDFKFIKEDDKLSGDPYTARWSYMSGWCLAGSKDTFDRLRSDDGGVPFTTEFKTYFEDTDLSFRAGDLGIELKIVPVPVTHFGHMTTKDHDISKLYREAREMFVKKWSGRRQ